MDINVKVGGKFKNINEADFNINNIKIDSEDNILGTDYSSVKLIGGMTIKVFEVTYNSSSAYLEKEYEFKKAFSNQCIAVIAGAVSSDRSYLIVNSTPKTNANCLISVRHSNNSALGNITIKGIAIGY